ncbi:MAG: hypothetical protein J6P89_04480, partial [Oscillospiraceae bacterium]|nr:hypothetical protein [Oscillospiraceae bacterium]
MIEKLVGDIPRIKTDEGSYYIDDEGIKHCKVCDEALETVVRWPWGVKKEACMCKCQRDSYNADMAALKT